MTGEPMTEDKATEKEAKLIIFMQKLLCERFGHKITSAFIRDDVNKKYRGCDYCEYREYL